MKLVLTSERALLPVVDAVELIARHIVDRDERPVLVDDGGWQVVPDPQARPAPNILLVAKERMWAGRIREAAVSGMLKLYDAEGFRIEHDSKTFAFACVKPAGLAQWLVDAYDKDVVLDGMRVEPTPAPAERETLKREVLVEKYKGIWPSIEADLQEGSRNGLMAAAGMAHSIYDVQRALRWARERDKLRLEQNGPVSTALHDLPAGFFNPDGK